MLHGEGHGLRYNPSLDGLRAVAVLAVVAFHCQVPYASGGSIGVDVFFVLSGYLITSILRAELKETGSISLRRFYWRRALRLWPPLLLMLAGFAIASPILFPEADVLGHVLLAGLYLSDYSFAFWRQPAWLGHTWSLAVEEHFYLIWPALMLLIAKLSVRQAVAVLALAFIVATAWRVVDLMAWGDFHRTYFRFDTRMSGLILGGLVAVLPWRPTDKEATWIGRMSGFVLGVALVAPRLIPIPLVWLVVDLAAAGFVLSLVSGHATTFGQMLSRPLLVYLGMISYSLYLWHVPMAVLLRDHFDPALTVLIVASLSIGIAALSWEFVEKPLKAMRERLPAAA